MTFLDYPDGRDEWVRERLLDADDIAAWRAEFPCPELDRPTSEQMVERVAAERAPVLSEYDARDWGWWESHDDSE